MQRVSGIGGLFFKAADPVALARWYRDVLGVDTYSEEQGDVWWPVRVDDLDAMREQLRAAGATVIDDVQEMAGIGRFGWAEDPEGNRFELWEPAPEARQKPE